MSSEKNKKVEQLSHTKEEALLGRRLLDIDALCSKRYAVMSSAFLSETEIAYCEMLIHLFDSKCFFFGGYDGAERRVAVFLPDENYEQDDDEQVITALEIRHSSSIGHRDVLGSILGLGIERDVVGDILIGNEKSYVIVTKEIVPYILQNFTKIGRNNISVSEVPFSSLEVPERKTEEIFSTVASLRLDCIAAEGFRLSRESAQSAIKKQLVQVNHKIVESPSYNIKEKDVISLRGKGKIILDSIGTNSRKGIIRVNILKFV